MSTDQRIDVTIAANADALVQLKAVITGFAENVTKGFKDIGESMQLSTQQAEGLNAKMRTTAVSIGLFQPLINVVMGFNSQIKDAVTTSISWTKETNSLAKALGTTTEVAGGISKALGRLGIDTDTYRGAVFMLQRNL